MDADDHYNRFLAPGERVVAVLEYANSQLVWDIFLGLAVFFFFYPFASAIGLILGVFVLIQGLYKKITLRYIITEKRVVIKRGLIGQSTVSAEYAKVTDVVVKQGVVGRLLLRTGTIILNTAGTDMSEVVLRWVQDPFKSKDIIYAQLHRQ